MHPTWRIVYGSVRGTPRPCVRRYASTRWNGVLAQAERLGASKVIYINLDDSLGEKNKHTSHLEVVDWFHDHSGKHPEATSLQEWLLLFGMHSAHRAGGRDRRSTPVLAGEDGAAAQSPSSIRAAHSLSQQEQSGAQDPGRLAPLAARRLGSVRTVRTVGTLPRN